MSHTPIVTTGPDYRARRVAEIDVLLAECMRARGAETRNVALDHYAADLMREREGIVEIAGLLAKAMQEKEAARPRRSAKTTIQAPDDVMLYVGDASREILFTDAEGAMVFARRGLVFVSRGEWDAIVSARVETLRDLYLRAGGTERGSRRDLQMYERDLLLVLDGDERWDPRAIMRRLGRAEGARVDDWIEGEMGTDTDIRLLYKWWKHARTPGLARFFEDEAQYARAATWWGDPPTKSIEEFFL